VARLRAPGGCPWDREQDHASLRPFLLEEAYEVYDALEGGATPALAEELGDLWLQIVLHAQHAAEAGVFDLSDVERSIMTKIVRRHPHVFGDGAARTSAEVTRAWEDIKADERAATDRGGAAPTASPDMPAAFAGLSRSLPALMYANEMQERAAGLGYDWPDIEGVIDKVAEEATELLGADDQANRAEEYGDLLFVLVNLARKLQVDPEAALRAASRKFARRFARVERLADERQLRLKALGLDELDELWQEVKREESWAREGRVTSEGVEA
jgi:MazG family protein